MTRSNRVRRQQQQAGNNNHDTETQGQVEALADAAFGQLHATMKHERKDNTSNDYSSQIEHFSPYGLRKGPASSDGRAPPQR